MSEKRLSELAALLEIFAEELHDQADERREKAINARAGMAHIDKAESDAWAVSFSASYQVLRGIAVAVDKTLERAMTSTDTALTENRKEGL